MARFAAGTTIRISVEVADYDDTLIDPSSLPTVTILKGSTTTLAATEMVKLDSITGKYYYRWQSAANLDLGKYETKITVVNDVRTSIKHDERAFYLY